MCGIFGYTGKSPAAPIVREGLKRLEYRGYDSCGIATIDVSGLKRKRKVGAVNEFLADSLLGFCGIGHTRWATHGGITKANAHPHIVGSIAIVHNGMVANFTELRKELIFNGARIESQTDTEVIAHLIYDNLSDSRTLCEAVALACDQIQGHNAIAVICKDEPETIVCARMGHAVGLAVGIGSDGAYVSSDIQALSGFCHEADVLESGTIVSVNPDGMKIYTGETVKCSIPAHKDIVSGDRMLAEINEQAEVAKRWENFIPAIISCPRHTLVACGTSYHAALIGRHYFENFSHIPTKVELAGEVYPSPDSSVLGITQSGETADTILAMETAKENGSRVSVLTNCRYSAATRIADSVYPMLAGPEVGVAATKSFTATIMALYSMAGGKIKSLSDAIEKTLSLSDDIHELAKVFLSENTRWLVIGRGLDYPLALECALKLKEIAYLDAHGHSGAEMKHGPIALIEKGTPVVAICTDSTKTDKMASHIEQVRARGANVIAIVTANANVHADHILTVPTTSRWLQPVVTAIPLQLLAYWLSIEQGIDPDRPRNLAKSVTVE